MYCEYYGFNEKPFTITPNSRFVFLSKNHREAFAHLLYGIENRVGFVELTGEVGTGKTTVLRTLLGQLGDDQHHTALIFNPSLTADELLPLIAREFGIVREGGGNVELLDSLYRFLLKENADGRSVVLVMDEAQNLSPEVMEQVRLISNLETETEKLIQIVLAGQPELEALLGRSDLRQIRQRIAVRFNLRPMDFEDTCAYVMHRLEVAGGTGNVVFTPAALRRLYASSHGTPRLINVYCDRALLVGYGDGVREISARMMAQAIREVRGERKFRPLARPVLILALLLCLVGAILLFGFSLHWKAPSRQVRDNIIPATDMLKGKPEEGTR
jgi:general secretion pathway protein A